MNEKASNDIAENILAVNQAFYDAFAKGEYAALEKIWARNYEISVTHPGQHTIYGYESVLDSWRHILGDGGNNEISCRSAVAFQHGCMAYVSCIEVFPEGELIAINIFIEEQGEWLMVYHQAGPASHRSSESIRILH